MPKKRFQRGKRFMLKLNKLEVFPVERNWITIVLIVISVVLFTASWRYYNDPRGEPDYDRKRMTDITSCIGFAKHKGFDAAQPKDSTESSRVIEVTSNTIDEPAYTFAAVESVLLACDNIELKSFCIGLSSECSIDGMKMVLVYEKPNAH